MGTGLADVATDDHTLEQLDFWKDVVATDDPLLGSRALDPEVDTAGTVETIRVNATPEVTDALLTSLPRLFHGGVNDGLMTALALALAAWRSRRGIESTSALIRLEGHGREEEVLPGADISRTVGWFTTMFPVAMDLSGIDIADALAGGPAAAAAIKAVKEQLAAVPDKGIGYGLLRYLNPETSGQLPAAVPGQVGFNYLGRSTVAEIPEGVPGWTPASDLTIAGDFDADQPAAAVIDINSVIADGVLTAGFAFPTTLLAAADVQEFAQLWIEALEGLVRHAETGRGGHTPSDFPLVNVGQLDVEVWERQYPALTDIWPTSPLQLGLVFHAMYSAEAEDVYTIQASVELGGEVDIPRLRGAAEAMLRRYPNLRAGFVVDRLGTPMQVVVENVELDWTEVDISHLTDGEVAAEISNVREADRIRNFDLEKPPLMRFSVIKTTKTNYHLVLTSHHLLLDGWSMPLLMRDLLVLYATRGDTSVLPSVHSYKNYLSWLTKRDRPATLQVWSEALAGAEPTLVAPESRASETVAEIDSVSAVFDSAAFGRMQRYVADTGVTMNTLIQSAWAVVLSRVTDDDDVVFGATVSGRPADLTGVETMVGLFINTLPVRVRVDDRNSVKQLLQGLQSEQTALLDHHYVGLPEIQKAAGVNQLFDSLVVFESYPVDQEGLQAAASNIDGMAVVKADFADATHYPLTLLIAVGAEMELKLRYMSSRFDRSTAQRLSARLVRVLEQFLDDPEALVRDVDILTADERAGLIVSQTTAVIEDAGKNSLAAALDDAVEEGPEAPAVLDGDNELTFDELDRKSAQLARVLIGRGVGPGDVVGIGGRRGTNTIIAMWAVAKTGAAIAPAREGVMVIDPAELEGEARNAASHPISYADRVRTLAVTDPAIVLGSKVYSQREALDVAADLRSRSGVDYESTLYARSESGVAEVVEFLIAATAGAAIAIGSDGDVDDVLLDEQVTHAVFDAATADAVQGSELDATIVCAGDEIEVARPRGI